MSHYSLLVINDGKKFLEEQLYKYNENLECPRYISKEEIVKKVREDIQYWKDNVYSEYEKDPDGFLERHRYDTIHIDYVTKQLPERFAWDDNQCYQYYIGYVDDENIMDDGSVYTTYNEDSKYDYYSVGGRGDILLTKDGEYVSECKIGDIDTDSEFMKEFCTYAVVDTNGNWIAPGEVGWFGCSSETEEEWETWAERYVDRFFRNSDPDLYVYTLDCHI